MPFTTHKQKKKPPPRPPPPNFTKYKSKSSLYLNQPNQTVNLIEWSPPNSPKSERTRNFGGSVSSSFSSSTSSLASSKKSFEFEPPGLNNIWPVQLQPTSIPHINNGAANFQSYVLPPPPQANKVNRSTNPGNSSNLNVSPFIGPTIIRPKGKPLCSRNDDISPKSESPPMPSIPPPSPPKEEAVIETPYGIALFNYPASHPSDLALQEGDVVLILRRINDDWLYGKVIDKEGMFPENYLDIQVPLKNEENVVTALYDFPAQMPEDLNLKAGQKVRVTKRISEDWLYGESNGQSGQFPSNFVNRVPNNL